MAPLSSHVPVEFIVSLAVSGAMVLRIVLMAVMKKIVVSIYYLKEQVLFFKIHIQYINHLSLIWYLLPAFAIEKTVAAAF